MSQIHSFREFLQESYTPNKHLAHLQDLVIDQGSLGIEFIAEILTNLETGVVDISTKIDGAPSLVMGKNDKGFFVATKSYFSHDQKLNYTPEDIDRHYDDLGLRHKLKMALQYLPGLEFPPGLVLQGDMLFTDDTLKKEVISGVSHLTFQPNTIVYAIPEPLVGSSKFGIIFHCSNETVSKLIMTPDVWFQTSAVPSKIVFPELHQRICELRKFANSIHKMFLSQISQSIMYKKALHKWNNDKVRSGESVTNCISHAMGFIENMEAELNKRAEEAKKPDTRLNRLVEKQFVLDFFKAHAIDLKKLFELQQMVITTKDLLLKKLEDVDTMKSFYRNDDGSLTPAKPEGFVIADKFKKLPIIKLVDQKSFSYRNFNGSKPWKN